MRTVRIARWFFSVCLLLLLISRLPAGDIREVWSEGGTSGAAIYHQLWRSQSPITLMMHDAGVRNHDEAYPVPTLSEAEDAIKEALSSWQNVPTANSPVEYAGTTGTALSGCDFTNIVTWSDDESIWEEYARTFARGITWTYVGELLLLNDTTRDSVKCGQTAVSLPDAFPNDTVLEAGTILDADMTFNFTEFSFGSSPDDFDRVGDIQQIAVHELGHMLGLSHTSLNFTTDPNGDAYPATMFIPFQSHPVQLVNAQRLLDDDDISSIGSAYPGPGFWPGGTSPFTTGAISGIVSQPDGSPASGVRVWAFRASDPSLPKYESFTATEDDWDSANVPAGQYTIEGVAPGEYYVCVLPWGNKYPVPFFADHEFVVNRGGYNVTVANGSGNFGFVSECFDDVPTKLEETEFEWPASAKKVVVTAGKTTDDIDFVTGTVSDVMLILDRSGSMALTSGTPGMSKLEALQKAAKMFVDYLDRTRGHRLGLIQFREYIVPLTPVFDLQPLNGDTQPTAGSAISGMTAGGWTNIIAGVDAGVEQLTSVTEPKAQQVMLLFSDGKHNRPPGSDLAVIGDWIVDNDLLFYSVGFGTDVDEPLLPEIAAETGGEHFNEADLDPVDLAKKFLTIAARISGETAFYDPRFTLSLREAGIVDVGVTEKDSSLVVVASWLTRDPDLFDVSITTPGGCHSSARGPSGSKARRADSHQILRLPLPFVCDGRESHAGTWRVEVQRVGGSAAPEVVDVSVFGRSRERLVAEFANTHDGPVVRAKVLDRHRIRTGGTIRAEMVLPFPPTGDSEDEDASGSRGDAGDEAGRTGPQRIVQIALADDGAHSDTERGDGIFGAALRPEQPGTYHIRLIAEYEHREIPITRELSTAFYFDGMITEGRSSRSGLVPSRDKLERLDHLAGVVRDYVAPKLGH